MPRVEEIKKFSAAGRVFWTARFAWFDRLQQLEVETLSYHGKYSGKEKESKITMEEICDERLYFWHIFLGISECNNNSIVLEAYLLLGKIASAEYPIPRKYKVCNVLENNLR